MTLILETDRLTLRTWAHEDAADLFEICRDDDVMKYIGTGKAYETRKEAEDFLVWAIAYQMEHGFCRWAVLEKSSYAIIGSCGFARPHGTEEIELGYLFSKSVWGRGFATEAASECLKLGFEKFGFREIIAMTDLENAASQKILENIGFVKRGVEILKNQETLVYLAINNTK